MVATVLGPVGSPANERMAGLTTTMYAIVAKVVTPARISARAVVPRFSISKKSTATAAMVLFLSAGPRDGTEAHAPPLRLCQPRSLARDRRRHAARDGSGGASAPEPARDGQGTERVCAVPGAGPRPGLAGQAQRASPLPPARVRGRAQDQRPRVA